MTFPAAPPPAPLTAPRCDRTVAWQALVGHHEAHGRDYDIREAFAADPQRARGFAFDAPEIHADLSKNRLGLAALKHLLELARECRLEARRDALLAGSVVNATEGRAALHTALRAPRGTSSEADHAHDVLDAMLVYADNLRAQVTAGRSPVRHIVNIGIGGSDLGPQMAVQALQAWAHAQLQCHFVSNVDGSDLMSVLRHLSPQEVLFVVASKTFTTVETLANAEAARAWFLAGGMAETDIPRHFVAATANAQAAQAFGITTTFAFWDWVGGRFSMWSAIGLPIAIAIGSEFFRALLDGAHAMDEHFATTPLERNVPVLLGLLDIWNRNFHGWPTRCVVPYHQGLRRLPAYLQQLEMESNGKSVDCAGEPVMAASSPVIWGEPGTNGQHAFFQMLHQGTDVVPVEFIVTRRPTILGEPQGELAARLHHQHALLVASALAQSRALMLGKTPDEASRETAPTAAPGADKQSIARHRSFPGNRPSTVLLLDALTPRALGALIALYEHRVFTTGALWGINSFDQWGVELGKSLTKDLLPRLASGDVTGLDGSTAALLGRLRDA